MHLTRLEGYVLSVFAWSSFSGLQTLFQSVSLLEGAPERGAFTNHVPRLLLKENSITQTEFCAWKWACYFIQCQGYQSVLASYRSLTNSMVASRVAPRVASRVASLLQNRPWNRLQNFLSLDTQDVERGQLWCSHHWPKTHCVFSLCLSVCAMSGEICCLRLTTITQKYT